jgi:hypothetical protein
VLDRLTPGDFAVVARQHRLTPFLDAASVMRALEAEAAQKPDAARRIGFV